MVLSDTIMLCDCPGLVFPSFVNSKAEMYCCGVLPISQLRDHICASPCFVVHEFLLYVLTFSVVVLQIIQHRANSCVIVFQSEFSSERTESRSLRPRQQKKPTPLVFTRFWRCVQEHRTIRRVLDAFRSLSFCCSHMPATAATLRLAKVGLTLHVQHATSCGIT